MSLSSVSWPACFLWLFVDVSGQSSSATSPEESERTERSTGTEEMFCAKLLLVLSDYCEFSD